jgi:hypothetical protein
MDQLTSYGFYGGLALALLVWAFHFVYERGRLRGASEADDSMADLPKVEWLNGEDSPTGRQCLDCRAYALGVQLVTKDSEALERFADSTQSDGSELDGQSPENSWLVDVKWTFDYEQSETIQSGMRPQVAEDMWMIDCRGSRLYFRRSWSGQLVFMANFNRIPAGGASITRLWVPGDEPFNQQSPEYLAAYVRHLIDTHLLGTLTPFPIPPDFPKDEEKIAQFVFHSVGRRGWLAEYFKTGDERQDIHE